MSARVEVAVVGSTGYAGLELARLLLRHPRVDRATFYLRGENSSASCLCELFPELRGLGEAPCRPFSTEGIASSGAEVVFLSTPHEVSLQLVPPLVEAGLRVVDLSGAFRFREPDTFERWYKLPPAAGALLESAVYGLPELYGHALRQARLVANPGCYPTSAILALRPLVAAGLVSRERGVVCDSKSGASGAGKEPKREMHFVEVNENLRAYGVFEHRHTPEILEHAGLESEELMFTTHLLPVERGILSTMYVWLDPADSFEEPTRPEAIESFYRCFYAGHPLVRIWPAGSLPELHHVVRTNFCDIGFALDPSGERLVIVSCLDNLGKGAAGQAVQNFNGMMGYEEDCGLK
jgi:N-acetyl-gamma-glutamyl-phosphate reductase